VAVVLVHADQNSAKAKAKGFYFYPSPSCMHFHVKVDDIILPAFAIAMCSLLAILRERACCCSGTRAQARLVH
jgi:hypothetical protein